MLKFNGVISKTIERGGRNGGKLYSFFLRGQDGLFKLGTETMKFKEGAGIEFEANDKLEVNVESMKESVVKQATVADKTSASAGISAFVDHRAEENAARQRNINYQSAHKDAIEVTKYLIDKEIIKLPIKTASQYDIVMATIEELTGTFYDVFSVDHTPNEPNKPESVESSEDDE